MWMAAQNYYSQFSNSLPSDPSYFPLGVWFESVVSQADVDLDKDAGLNLYVVLTANSNLSLVQRNGMRAILQQSEWRTNQTAINSPAVAGWELFDEIDMQQGPGQGYTTLNNILAQLPNDGRMRYNNYGKGVMFWETDAQAERFVNDFQQVVSNDIYWFTDPNVSGSSEGGKLLNGGHPLTPTQTRRAANYGYTVDRMRALDIEAASRSGISWRWAGRSPRRRRRGPGPFSRLKSGRRCGTASSQGRGASSTSTTASVAPTRAQHCLREPAYAAVRAAVKSTNQLVTQLAPVLNAPFADGFVSAGPSVRTMAKFHDNKYYVFAGSKENAASTPTLSLSGVDSGTATVIGENRTIPISNGRFSDSFADGNAIHIYRIDNQ